MTPGLVMLWAVAVLVVILVFACIWAVLMQQVHEARKRATELEAMRRQLGLDQDPNSPWPTK